DGDTLRVDAERVRVRARPADGGLGVVHERRKSCLTTEPVLRGDGDVPERRKRSNALGQRLLASSREAATMEVNRRHPFLGARGRSIDVEFEIEVAALPEQDIFLNRDCGRSLLRL